MRYRVIPALLLAATAAIVVPRFAEALGPTCLVGFTGEDFSSIQAAVDNPACVTVLLRPTAFHEQVTITRSVSLAGQSFVVGTQQFITTLKPPATMTPPYALVRIIGRKVKVKVKHIVFEGPGPAEGLIGIRAEKDTKLTIRDSNFVNIQPDPLNAGTGFVAIHSGEPSTVQQVTTADITGMRFEGYQNAAIISEGPGTVLTIDSILIDAGDGRPADTAAPTGIIVRNGATATINRSDIDDNRRTGGGGVGIKIEGAPRTVKVTYNNVFRNDTGLVVDGTDGIKVFRNAFDQGGDGLVLGVTTAVNSLSVSSNRVEDGTGIGIRLGQGTKNSIYSNDLLSNTGGGATVGAAAIANTISRNRAQNNGGLAFDDDSTGKLTGKTANTYSKNTCSGNNGGGAQSSPAGLCLLGP